MHFQERQQAPRGGMQPCVPPDACGWPRVPPRGRGPFETEIQARFTPIRVLTQAVKTRRLFKGLDRSAGTFAASTPDNRRIAEKLGPVNAKAQKPLC